MRTALLRATALALASVMLMAGLAGAVAQRPAATQAFNTMTDIPVRGSTALGHVFRGRLDIVRFRSIEGQLYAVGDLTGRLRTEAGVLVGQITDKRVRLPLTFADPVASAAAVTPAGTTCQILNLRLGPLDLDLLGLVVHLDRVVLTITAEPGPGNLLGNLLCAITGLLDAGSPLSGVVAQLLNVLRQLLGLFG